MQYEQLVLELFERVKILENKVARLESSNAKNIPVSEKKIGKYFQLSNFLQESDADSLTLFFGEIEKIVGFELPQSAKNHRAFWANTDSHSISLSWLSVGYEVSDADMEHQCVCFSRSEFLKKSKSGVKEFELNGEVYSIEIGYHDGRTFRLFKKNGNEVIDFEGNQKRFIVAKLRELLDENPNLNITDEEKGYILNYGPGKTQGQNSNKLAKVLYRLLPENEGEKTQADKLREFCNITYIIPARNRNEKTITIRAGDVRSALNIRDRMSAISNALRGKKFEELAHVRLVDKNTPPSGAGMNSYFTFDILPI